MEHGGVPVSLDQVRMAITIIQKMVVEEVNKKPKYIDPDESLFHGAVKLKPNCKLFGYKNAKGSIHRQETINRQLGAD